jgi:septation ring formation regulator EzrA
MATIEWPEGMDERMRALVSLDIQRNAVLLSAIDSSVQTVREDINLAQQANMKMFNTVREDFTDLRTEVRDGFERVDGRLDRMDGRLDRMDNKLDKVLEKLD